MFIFNKMVIFVYMRERNGYDVYWGRTAMRERNAFDTNYIHTGVLYPSGIDVQHVIIDGWTREDLDRFERVIRGVLQTGNPLKPIHRIKKHLL